MKNISKKNVVFHLLGNISSRVIPIFFGLFISRYFGNANYTEFVELLILGNLIISFGISGFVPQLMISNSSKTEKWNLFIISQFVVSLILFVLILFNCNRNELMTNVFLIVFCLGYSFLSTMSAVLNSNNKYSEVTKVWVANFFSFLSLCIIAYFFKFDFEKLLLIYSLIYFISGCYLFIVVSRLGMLDFKLKNNFRKKGFVEILKNALLICGFAGFTLLGFKMTINSISVELDKQFFAFSYQIFSVVMFLPLILGGIIIPYLSNSNEIHSKKVNKLLYSYFLISIITVVFVMLFVNPLLKLYSFELSYHNKLTLMIILLSAVIGAVNTFYIHYFNSYKKYLVTFFAGIFWCIGVFLPISIVNFSIESSVFASVLILSSYTLSLFFLILNRKYSFIK